MKLNTFLLPRIDDLLGSAKYFTTLDLATGYWKIQVAVNSIAFITPNGLFEFQVMPFGLTNARGVFSVLCRLYVLSGLNPTESPNFVSIYIDDILMDEHLNHVSLVLGAGLKLKPCKCHFVCQEVEYLGHLITPHGLLPNPKTSVQSQISQLQHQLNSSLAWRLTTDISSRVC